MGYEFEPIRGCKNTKKGDTCPDSGPIALPNPAKRFFFIFACFLINNIRMRILVLANKFPYPAKDGGSIATLTLARSLAGAGHAVSVMAMNTSKHYCDPDGVPGELSKLIRFISVPVDTSIRPGRLVMNYFFGKLPYNAERFFNREFRFRLQRLLKEESFDIVQMEGLYLAPYIGDIRALSAARVVMRAHNIEHEIWERSAAVQSGLRKFYFSHLASRIRAMEINYANQYDAMVPITERDALRLKELGCIIPVHVTPTGVDAVQYAPDPAAMRFPSVFHIGALDWIPNQEGLNWFFAEVWPKVLEKMPELVFYLAGRNAPADYRESRQPNVVYAGEVSDAHKFIRSGAVMVVPLLSGSGMRIKIIEAMALGKAVVTTSIGTEGISTTHGSDILVADDAASFARCVSDLTSDRSACLRMGEKARIFVTTHYDNARITAALSDFYHQLSG
jgi:glycosyltransferase involved in cell wall biosynthesis